VLAGVMNIQYSMRIIGERIRAEQQVPERGATEYPPAALLAVPLFHTSGCYSIFLSNLLRGGKIVMLRKWHAERALNLIEQERVTAFSGPPSMLWDLVRARSHGRDLRSLTSIGVAGQELRPQLLREIVAAFPQAVIGRGYGMTEANGSVCLIAGDELLRHPTSSGRVIATADIKLVDEAGSETPPGSVGEICIRGAMVMLGYCRRPQETAAALRDGWLHTGDLGRLDRDGYLHIIDRKKNIIISGGDKISCSEIERVAVEHPAVIDAAVFGVADDRLGEIPAIAVVLKPDCLIDSFALKSHIAAQLAIYKVPRLVMYCNALPCNSLGKVNRNELRRQFTVLHPRYRIDAEEITALSLQDTARKEATRER
jgi:long-chain acyl-CoA synthetase